MRSQGHWWAGWWGWGGPGSPQSEHPPPCQCKEQQHWVTLGCHEGSQAAKYEGRGGMNSEGGIEGAVPGPQHSSSALFQRMLGMLT